jgi:hypothetical protein
MAVGFRERFVEADGFRIRYMEGGRAGTRKGRNVCNREGFRMPDSASGDDAASLASGYLISSRCRRSLLLQLEHAQEMAAHESPRTTKLYHRTKERLTQGEVERIRL